jgi:hypothetical protein
VASQRGDLAQVFLGHGIGKLFQGSVPIIDGGQMAEV